MGQFIHGVQDRIKTSSSSLALFALRLISGIVLGLTFALVGEEIIGYGSFAFMFVIISITAVLIRVSANWGVFSVLLFDLVCVLIGALLRMYVLIAPGA